MFNDIVQKLTPEILNITREVLAQNLPPMLNVYAELKKRAELCDGPLIVSIKQLAQSLGWNTSDLESTLTTWSITTLSTIGRIILMMNG